VSVFAMYEEVIEQPSDTTMTMMMRLRNPSVGGVYIVVSIELYWNHTIEIYTSFLLLRMRTIVRMILMRM